MNVLYDHQIWLMQRFGGISRYFIELMKNNWENFITGMKNDLCPNKIELKSGEYLMDVIKKLGLKIPRIK